MQCTVPVAESLARRVLQEAGASRDNAASVVRALMAAELDDLPSHGLARVAYYADQVAAGKVDGRATPSLTEQGAVVRVDAATGFAYPAIEAGIAPAVEQARSHGIAALGVANSHHFGVAGHHVEAMARQGMVALGFGNAPASIAPWGGKRPLFGTDPIAFAAPRAGSDPLVIDLSVSRVARGKVMMAQRTGESIPDDWALDRDGQPTTDPTAAMAGSVRPMGDAKGAALALMVELLSAGLTGSSFAYEASSLFNAEGDPPRLGQLFIVMDPRFFGAGDGFVDRVEAMLAMMVEEPGVRLPGARRLAARQSNAKMIDIDETILADLERRAGDQDADSGAR
ncbi:Ldh family oxidoreductase [Spiribacter vilamensis]|uniref:(2R)-3-sulfolactate dehydrogenase (NADP+) n=1 Tax=Spiribacter vilamensis TaxID=531306 RepID=A0A4Q8CZE3_9GAMM|nr:Ldh family oxidoreductase [Spiribacter vilamensis]RZU98307.1 (2R)-3-sulfolactate dehydrogenase (NADP+) [Spiribacter vilamensis]TVO60803.1 Ldh family oxidoreductase [Spiribacter vilamensis]